jgi:hypothetical protein
MNQQPIDFTKARLERIENLLDELQKELHVFQQYMDVKPEMALYSHMKALIADMKKTKDPHAFAAKLKGLNQSIAGILIIAVPTSVKKVMQNMQRAHADFNPNQFAAGAKAMEEAFGGFQAHFDPTKTMHPEPNNDPQELVDMLGLQEHVRKKDNNKDPFQDLFKKYKGGVE